AWNVSFRGNRLFGEIENLIGSHRKANGPGLFPGHFARIQTVGTAAVFERASKERFRLENRRYPSADSTRSQKSSAVRMVKGFPDFEQDLTLTQYVGIASLCIPKRKGKRPIGFPLAISTTRNYWGAADKTHFGSTVSSVWVSTFQLTGLGF